MGILTRRQGEAFVVSSDHDADGTERKRAPRRVKAVYQVWTGKQWSQNLDDALFFDSLDDADEYVRANYAQVAKIG